MLVEAYNGVHVFVGQGVPPTTPWEGQEREARWRRGCAV